ncbi:MAG TPA: CHAT domain-containing protein [Anaerolineaceae bacterium]|nr:CHAT domain-containing protein [Anaerolineaceae bacterium]
MEKIQYIDFDIRIERREDAYRAVVLNSPAGEAETLFQLPWLGSDLDNLIRRMGHLRGGIRRLESPESETARIFGSGLFNALFSNAVRSCFESSRARLKEGSGLRLRLRLSEVPELLDVPWEFLYDPEADRFLILSVETPLVRYIDLPHVAGPLQVQPPLEIIAAISSPRDYRPLDVAREWDKLKQALSDLEKNGLVRMHGLESATLANLHRQLRRQACHIFHFIGHGIFDEAAQDGILLFEDEGNRGRPVTGRELGTLFYDYRSSMRLVMLNACEGARTSRSDPFAGAAQSLVQKGIPAVIAMQFEISEEAAITLAHEFYSALSEGYPVDAALSEARKSIYTQSAEYTSNVEWGTPVLYMRSPDGVIFDIQAHPSPLEVREPPIQPDLTAEKLNRLYDDGLEAYVLGQWEKACAAFEAVLKLNPSYQDASARLEECQKKARLVALQSKANLAIEGMNWDEAVQILEELVSLDPTYGQSELLLANTRKQKQISGLYAQAKRLHHSEKWEAVLKIRDQIRTLEPQPADPDNLFPAAQAALDEIQKQSRLEKTYNLALREIAAGNWDNAAQLLFEIQSIQPGYRESDRLAQIVDTNRKETIERKQRQEQVTLLYAQAAEHARSRRWEKALAIMEQITKLEPAFPDSQGIASRAQIELEQLQQKAETQKRVIAQIVHKNKPENFEPVSSDEISTGISQHKGINVIPENFSNSFDFNIFFKQVRSRLSTYDHSFEGFIKQLNRNQKILMVGIVLLVLTLAAGLVLFILGAGGSFLKPANPGVTGYSSYIYFVSDQDGKKEIFSLVNGNRIQVTHTPGQFQSWNPVISPDGMYFTSNRNGKQEIYLLDNQGIMQVTHTPGNFQSWNPNYAPDRSLLFTSDRSGGKEVYRLDQKGTTKVTSSSQGESWDPFVSLNGEIFFTSNRSGKREVYRLNNNGVSRLTNTPGKFESWDPFVDDDGTIYFTSNRDGTVEIFKLEKGQTVQMTNTPNGKNSWGVLDVSNGTMIFSSDRNQKSEIFLMDMKGVIQITHTRGDRVSWSVSSED